MHQCLQIPEVVSLIAGELKNIPGTSKSNLLAMALTCKGFDAGFDGLWDFLVDFRQIIGCLPDDICVETKEINEEDYPIFTIDFRRSPTPKDLERYREMYAHRIRGFSLDTDGEHGFTFFSTTAFQLLQLATNFKPGALSPHLQTMAGWMPYHLSERTSSFPYISLFMGSQMSSIDFEFTSDLITDLEAGTIRYALEASPSVTSLWLFDNLSGDSPQPSPNVEEWVLNSPWLELEELELSTPLSPTAFQRLSLLPKLRKFIHLHFTNTPKKSDLDFFTSLRHLELLTPDVNTALCFLECLAPTNELDTFSIKISGNSLELRVQTVLNAIVTKLRPAFLQYLNLRAWFDTDDSSHQFDISPLLSFHELRTIHLPAKMATSFNPNPLQGPTVWPKLVHLDLEPELRKPQLHTRLDHTHLALIVRGCPELQYLNLQVDTSQIPTTEDTSTQPPHNNMTRLLVYLPSPIASAGSVLAFFKTIFPRSMSFTTSPTVTSSSPPEDSPTGKWKLVKEGWDAYQGGSVV